ncbi:MAG TPA: diacylglycerol kinase family protein [Ktedonobacteraceae bacterium]|nr:diacylglycerol kinase family protein [Ktedonobacteraceae bacterium]
MRAVLILNPTSGISTITTIEGTQSSPEENEAAILASLHVYGIEPEVQYTTPEDTGQGLAARAALEGTDLVIVAGGDGTVHAVASGLIGTKTILGIIPTGTMNNLARSLHIPETIEEACAVIAEGKMHAIDVGKINDHLFIEVAGIGLEAALFPAAEEFKSPGIWSTLHSIVTGLRTLLAFRPTKLQIALDTKQRRAIDAIQVTICNAPYYGAHLQVAPGALMDDGLLDIVIYRHFSKLEYLRHAFSISQGKRIYQPKIRRRRARTLHITADIPMEIQADGVVYGHTPATIHVLPGALHVRVPHVEKTQRTRAGISEKERKASLNAR